MIRKLAGMTKLKDVVALGAAPLAAGTHGALGLN